MPPDVCCGCAREGRSRPGMAVSGGCQWRGGVSWSVGVRVGVGWEQVGKVCTGCTLVGQRRGGGRGRELVGCGEVLCPVFSAVCCWRARVKGRIGRDGWARSGPGPGAEVDRGARAVSRALGCGRGGFYVRASTLRGGGTGVCRWWHAIGCKRMQGGQGSWFSGVSSSLSDAPRLGATVRSPFPLAPALGLLAATPFTS